jgi:hypothetical protein
MLKRERDPELSRFDRGCLALRREGAIVGHVATTLGTFWSPGRARTVQQWVWLVVVWADGEKERAQEDYPPWTYVREISDGEFVWPYPGPRGGAYTVEWLADEEREAKWAELGITLDDF